VPVRFDEIEMEATMARKKSTSDFTKPCTACGRNLKCSDDRSISAFYRDKSTKSGFATWCKECEANYNRPYNAALKKAGVTRKSDLVKDSKKLAAFNRQMKDVRIERSSTSTDAKTVRKAAPKATAEKATNSRTARPRSTKKQA
jgi:hypothetical protein